VLVDGGLEVEPLVLQLSDSIDFIGAIHVNLSICLSIYLQLLPPPLAHVISGPLAAICRTFNLINITE